MHTENDKINLWYGTPDAPAPAGDVSKGKDLTITIGVKPMDASNKVDVHYRVNRGPVQSVPAKWVRNDNTRNAHYFLVNLPVFRTGDTVEYVAVCRCAGRQVPSQDEAKKLSASFRVIGARTIDTEDSQNPHSARIETSSSVTSFGGVVSSSVSTIPYILRLGSFLSLSRNLVMVGLGVQNDSPPNNIQPRLRDGIHLRWAFNKEKGFPLFGFYLFRRSHELGDWDSLSDDTVRLVQGSLPGTEFIAQVGIIKSDQVLVLTEDFPSPPPQLQPVVEFDLVNGLSFIRPFRDPARKVRVLIGFRRTADIKVTALLSYEGITVPVVETKVSGAGGKVVTATLEFDAITEIKIDAGPAALVDVWCVPVSKNATAGWETVPGFSYPMCLPITHPDYPCTPGRNEDLAAARNLVTHRIQYGVPDGFTLRQTVITTAGMVSVNRGSRIIMGTNTGWDESLAGNVMQISGDPTAYIVESVVPPEKLVLSRPYTDTSRNRVAYEIRPDPFGQLHDYLSHLVAGGIGAGTMASRSVPLPVYTAGTVTVNSNSPTVNGIGTIWNRELEGLSFQVLGDSTGMVTIGSNSSIVNGIGTHWSDNLVGLVFRIDGEREAYTILNVDSPTMLTLDRNYPGEIHSGKPYTIFDKTSYTIERVDSSTQLILDRNYVVYRGSGTSRRRMPYRIMSPLQSTGMGGVVPSRTSHHPLDLILLSTLHPAFAQMVGLYWIDQPDAPNQDTRFANITYDYLIIADHSGVGNLDPIRVLDILGGLTGGLDQLEGYIVFKKRMSPAPPLSVPDDLRVYALPGTTMRDLDGNVSDAPNSVGLRWNLGITEKGALLSDKSVMYHVWRSGLGNGETETAPGIYDLVTSGGPLLVTEPTEVPSQPPDWPPFPMHTFDRGLRDGWYSYGVSGIDIFGRHSARSASAAWYRWEPPPDPPPWYYTDPPVVPPPSPLMVHRTAIRLLNEVSPPPPNGVAAYALDSEDPNVLKDDAFNRWWTDLTTSGWYQALTSDDKRNLIGLRVSWLWTRSNMRQAPNIREFRIYYQPGQMNAILGRTRSVSIVSDTESNVETDIVNNQQTDAYIGAHLRIGNSAFKVMASESGSPLRLRVRHLGPYYSAGSVEVNNGSSIVTGTGTVWGTELAGLTLRLAGESVDYTILRVDSDTQLILERAYHGISNGGRAYAIIGVLPRANAPCTLAIPPIYNAGTVTVSNGAVIIDGRDTEWGTDLAGSWFTIEGRQKEYQIMQVNSPTQLTIDRGYEGSSGEEKRYAIRHSLFNDYGVSTNWQRRYYVVGYHEHVTEGVPPLKTAQGQELRGNSAAVSSATVTLDGSPDLSDPQLIGAPLFLENDSKRTDKTYLILAIDNTAKTVVVDGMPDTGNIPSPWVVGELMRRYEVFLPTADGSFRDGLPLSPSLSEPIAYAHVGVSAADGKTHALDDPKWTAGRWGGSDRFGKEGRVSPPAKIIRVLREPPPPPQIRTYDSDRVYATAADYHSHSFYAYHWVPSSGLKTHILRALDDTLFQVDWKRRSPSTQTQILEMHFPQEMRGSDPTVLTRRQQVINELNQLDTLRTNNDKAQAFAYYRSLSNDVLRVLAGLPGNEAAFTQLTIQPLDPEDHANDDQRGPNDPHDYTPDSSLRLYIDTLDGRTTNRYFYRCLYVDGAHNRGDLSLSTPPVYLPNVVPPRAPVITKILGGDRQITIKWTSNREPDLAEYRVYRTDNKEAARDLRLMIRVHTEAVPAGDPMARQAEVTWIDSLDRGLVIFYYRLVAVDDADNVSEPSQVVSCRTYKLPPAHPIWELPQRHPQPNPTHVFLSWTQPIDLHLTCLVERRVPGQRRWISISGWLPNGVYTFNDTPPDIAAAWEYRLRVRDNLGQTASALPTVLLPAQI